MREKNMINIKALINEDIINTHRKYIESKIKCNLLKFKSSFKKKERKEFIEESIEENIEEFIDEIIAEIAKKSNIFIAEPKILNQKIKEFEKNFLKQQCI